MKKILDVEGRRIRTAYADGDGGLIIETKEDLTPIIERNKAEYAQFDQTSRWGEELFDPKNKVATIPLVLFDDRPTSTRLWPSQSRPRCPPSSPRCRLPVLLCRTR